MLRSGFLDMQHALAIALAASATLTIMSSAIGQCTPLWSVTTGFGAQGVVHRALEWDPDGAGPLSPLLTLAGDFSSVGGNVPAHNIAFYDYATGVWSTAGTGTDGVIRALAVDGNGHLIVGGDFASAGGVARPGVARWDGGAWHGLGSGVDVGRSGVHALLTIGNQVVVGGDFSFAGSTAVNNVALWDGSVWTTLGNGLTHTAGTVLNGEPTGVFDLIAGASNVVAVGSFDRSGATQLASVAELLPSGWQAVGALPPGSLNSPVVRSAARHISGDLYVAGSAQGSDFVLRWNGATWTSLPGFGNRPTTIATTTAGDVVIGGSRILFATTSAVQRYTGTTWQTIATVWHDSLQPTVRCIVELPSQANRMLVGGQISSIDGTAVSGAAFERVGGGWFGDQGRFSRPARLYAGPEGELLASMDYQQIPFVTDFYYGDTAISGLARWNGSTFVPIPGAPSFVHDVDFDGRGGFVVTSNTGVFQWRDGNWIALGSPPALTTRIAITPHGGLFVVNTGFYGLTGTQWSYLNLPSSGDCVALPDGRLAVTDPSGGGGPAPRVYLYTPGSPTLQWQALGSPSDLDDWVFAIAEMPNGDLVIGGDFSLGNRVARWDGSSWQAMGAGFDDRVEQLHVCSDGRVLALGSFTASGSVACAGAAIWNGTTWEALSSPELLLRNAVAHPDGDFWAVTRNGRLARLQTPCPANSSTITQNCAATRLLSTAWPMLGSRHRAFGSGIPGNSLVVGVFGTAVQTLPLSALLPYGQSGCDVDVLPETLQLSLPIGDHVQLQFPVPNASALIGTTFIEQLVTIEVDASGLPFRARSSNTLALTIGSNH